MNELGISVPLRKVVSVVTDSYGQEWDKLDCGHKKEIGPVQRKSRRCEQCHENLVVDIMGPPRDTSGW